MPIAPPYSCAFFLSSAVSSSTLSRTSSRLRDLISASDAVARPPSCGRTPAGGAPWTPLPAFFGSPSSTAREKGRDDHDQRDSARRFQHLHLHRADRSAVPPVPDPRRAAAALPHGHAAHVRTRARRRRGGHGPGVAALDRLQPLRGGRVRGAELLAAGGAGAGGVQRQRLAGERQRLRLRQGAAARRRGDP